MEDLFCLEWNWFFIFSRNVHKNREVIRELGKSHHMMCISRRGDRKWGQEVESESDGSVIKERGHGV